MAYFLISILGMVVLLLPLRETPFETDSYGRKATLTSPTGAILPIALDEFNSLGAGCGEGYTVDLSQLGKNTTEGFFIVRDIDTGCFALGGDALIRRNGEIVNDIMLQDGDEILLRGTSLVFTIDQ